MPAAGHCTAIAQARVTTTAGPRIAPRVWRSTNRGTAPAGDSTAAPRHAANDARASVGNRATHMLNGRPQIPGVVRPCASMNNPTNRHPNASITRENRRVRPAATAARIATTSAHAEIPLTTTR